MTGFSGPGIHLLDLTNPLLPALVTGARVDAVPPGNAQLTIEPAAATTPYLAVGPQGVLTPASVVLASTTGPATQTPGADYLILTTGDLAPAASSLAALRAAQGLQTAVVDVGDVMTEFNYGIYSPHALQSFLSYVHATWNPVPRYVVLAGAASFDYRNFLGFGGELVPTLMVSTNSGLFSSDNHLVDINGDGIPDFAVGRLPVLTNAERQLQSYVAKLAAYEATPGGQWINQALFAADETGPDDGLANYAADSVAIAGGLPALYVPQQVAALSSSDITAARATLFSCARQHGLGLVNYFGHAGLDRLPRRSACWTVERCRHLDQRPCAIASSSAARSPATSIASTCPSFSSPSASCWPTQANGGAVGNLELRRSLSYHSEGKELARLFYLDLGIPGSFRLGDVMLHALTQYANEPGLLDTVDLYTLLGDPATQVKPLTAPTGGAGTSANTKE